MCHVNVDQHIRPTGKLLVNLSVRVDLRLRCTIMTFNRMVVARRRGAGKQLLLLRNVDPVKMVGKGTWSVTSSGSNNFVKQH